MRNADRRRWQGFIRRAWAITFAPVGHDVALCEADQGASARVLDFITGALPDLDANDRLNGARPGEIRARPRVAATLGRLWLLAQKRRTAKNIGR